MQRLVEFILATPIKTFEMWLGFVRFKLIVTDEEKQNETMRAAFLFLAGMKGITKDLILAIDPTQEVRLLITELFEKIVSKWSNIPADYLLPLMMNLIPELDTHKLNLLVKQLEILYEVIYLQYGANGDLYSVITLINAIKIKTDKIAWRDAKSSAKELENERRIINIVTEILAEQEKVTDFKLGESKRRIEELPKIREIGASGGLLFRGLAFEGINDQRIVYKECITIYKKIIGNSLYLDFIKELCIAYKPKIEEIIKEEVRQNDLLYEKYFNEKEVGAACVEITKDTIDSDAEIAKFVEKNPLLYKEIENYRLISVVLNIGQIPDSSKSARGFFID
jgi:hypothetical protein